MCIPTSELCPLCVHPQVQTELRRWLQKCRNQNHLIPAKRSITQITSRAREGFGCPPSSANISSVWLWVELLEISNQRHQRTVASIYSLSAAAQAGYVKGVLNGKHLNLHSKDVVMAEGEEHSGRQRLGVGRLAWRKDDTEKSVETETRPTWNKIHSSNWTRGLTTWSHVQYWCFRLIFWATFCLGAKE